MSEQWTFSFEIPIGDPEQCKLFLEIGQMFAKEEERIHYAENLHAFFEAIGAIAQKLYYVYHYPLLGSGEF